MRLNLFLVADCANISKDGKLNLMGVFQALNSVVFPTRCPTMHLVAMLLPELGEVGSCMMTIQLNDPDKNKLLEINMPMEIPPIQNGIRPQINTICELRDLGFPTPGTYEFVIFVDGVQKGECPLYVNQVTSLPKP